ERGGRDPRVAERARGGPRQQQNHEEVGDPDHRRTPTGQVWNRLGWYSGETVRHGWHSPGVASASHIAHAGLPFANPISDAAVDEAITLLPLPAEAHVFASGCGAGEM